MHFLLLGAALWLADALWQDYRFRVVSAPSEGALAMRIADWRRSHGRMPGAEERAAMYQAALDEEILFQEALRLGLHRRDPVVLRRLYQDVRFLGLDAPPAEAIRTALDMKLYTGDEVIRRRLLDRMRAIGRGPDPQPDEALLRQLYQDQLKRWHTPERLSFEQRFLRQPGSERAQAMLQELRQGQAGAGDPFLLGASFSALDREETARRFGEAFADGLWDLPDGVWSGPLHSPYGQHLIRINERIPPRPRPFAEVRERIAHDWREQQQAQRLRRWITTLRERYRVVAS